MSYDAIVERFKDMKSLCRYAARLQDDLKASEAREDALKKSMRTTIDNLRNDLRDKFAIAALTGLWSVDNAVPDFDYSARNCYRQADAMLNAREQRLSDFKGE